MRAKWLRRVAALLLIAALVLLTWGVYIPAKAQLAQWLLRDAWQRGVETRQAVRPWPWADTWPVARLRVPRYGVDQLVLQGDSGAVLAFGPGLNPAGVYPGERGTSLISAHRDTHFRFLRRLQIGDRLMIQNRSGAQLVFVVRDTAVIDIRRARLRREHDTALVSLVTCYPFEAVIPNGPLRYLVVAERLHASELPNA